jgi:hypothetical protein
MTLSKPDVPALLNFVTVRVSPGTPSDVAETARE